MNRTVPWSSDRPADPASMWDAGPPRDAEPSRARSRRDEHRDGMKAIAAQLSHIFEGDAGGSEPRGGGPAGGRRDDVRDVLRGAVAEIARRQADLDAHGEAPPPSPNPDVPRPAAPPADAVPPHRPSDAARPGRDGFPRAEARTTVPGAAGDGPGLIASEPSEIRRPGIDLSAEVAKTFASFSRDIQDSIRDADARPNIAALDRQVREIGRAVGGLGAEGAERDTIARIGEHTRETRDLLRAGAVRSVPLDAVERQVATLEARLGRLADGPLEASVAPLPPGFGDTMAEVRALLDGFKPGVAMTALDARLDDFTARIERGLDARGPAGLIEGLSLRVDEIHATLRSQLAEAALDTRPLEGLVRGLSDRIAQARDASSNFEQLEHAVRDVAARLDGAAGGVDPRGAAAIEAQLVRLGERLDRSESSLRALDGVESSLGELFSQFEVTRQVAIDAAETAARTAARDTLRAALQSPGLVHRSAEGAPGLAEQVSRGLSELRAFQDSAERRTESTLADIRTTVERLAQGIGPAERAAEPAPVDRPWRRQAVAPRTVEPAPVSIDPTDVLIEPGAGRAGAAPRVDIEPPSDAARAAVRGEEAAADGDGSAQFIAAARRAAQAAQASVAAGTASRAPRRAPTRKTARPPRASLPLGATLARARAYLDKRRRPVLLGLAAVVLLVGALEVVKIAAGPGSAHRVAAVEPSQLPAAPAAGAAPAPAAEPKPAALAEAVMPPAAAVRPPPLPSFVAGPARAQQPTPDGISETLRGRAAAGDPGAQVDVALRYAEGQGVPRDPRQAAAWFGKAAAQGFVPAEYRLGSAYEKGVGVDRDPVLATMWYAKAAEAGNVRAMHNLAVMSAEGAGGKPDYARAAQWFGKAATYGVRDSQFNLAILYARGLGIEQSLPQSYTWFAIAALGGDEDAAKKREEVGSKLDARSLASAKAAVDAYRAAVPPASANDGTDAAGSPRPAPGPAKVSAL